MADLDDEPRTPSRPHAVRLDSQGTELTWYCVRATYKSVHVREPRRRHLWERTFFLLSAPPHQGPADVRRRAEQVARTKEDEYVAVAGNTVRWIFHEVEDIEELPSFSPETGGEVYCELFTRVDKVASFSTYEPYQFL